MRTCWYRRPFRFDTILKGGKKERKKKKKKKRKKERNTISRDTPNQWLALNGRVLLSVLCCVTRLCDTCVDCTFFGFPGHERAEISPITYGTVCLHVAFVFVCLFEGCSTETVLLRIVNDILFALDNDNISVLLLLDLSDAFDTLDHQILLSRLNSVFGIQSTALQWFHSHLSDRYQSTSVNNSSSSPSQLMYGVPQGPFSSSCTLRLSPIS